MEIATTKSRYEVIIDEPNSSKIDPRFESVYRAEKYFLQDAKFADKAKLFNVPIEFRGTSQFIRTMLLEDSDSDDDLLVVHGFGGSWVTFYPLLPMLAKHYRVWTIDLLGMGGSSRPKFTATNHDEALEFFFESLEAWREKVGLKRFYVAGHSLGAYILGHYALKNSDQIIKFFLISPFGMTQKAPDADITESFNKRPWKERMRLKMMRWVWRKQYVPSQLYRGVGCFAKYWLNNYLTRRFRAEGETRDAFRVYLGAVFSLPTCSERCIYLMLKMPAFAGEVPLESAFLNSPPAFPIEFFFGDEDWMSSEGAKRVHASDKVNTNYHVISDSSHQVALNNPKELGERLILGKLSSNNQDDIRSTNGIFLQ